MRHKTGLGTVLLAVLFLGAEQPSAAVIETNNWISDQAPTTPINNAVWATGGTSASAGGNSFGTLVSDFSVTDDFAYSGVMRATADNDNMGVVFGWADTSNHYRMGWEGGGFGDASGAEGFWVIKESAGVSTILFEDSNLTWVVNTSYDFEVARTGNTIGFRLMQGATTLVSDSLNDTTFLSGNIGVYHESNTTAFRDLSVSQSPGSIPSPSTLVLLIAGVAMVAAGIRRNVARA